MGKLKALWMSLNVEEKLLALYVLSFVYTQAVAFCIGNKKILYTDMIFLSLFIVFIWKVFRNNRIHQATFTIKSIAAMVFLFMISFLNSVNLADSFIELLGLLYLIALFVVVSSLVNTRKKTDIFLYFWMITAVCVSLIGLLAFFAAWANKDFINSRFLFYTAIESMAHHFPRINSTFENINMFCAYLHVSLIFSVILFLSEASYKRKCFIVLCVFIMLFTALLTGSRRFTGLILSFFMILCFYGKDRISSIVKYASFLSFIIFLTASIITSIWVIFPAEIKTDRETNELTLKIDSRYSLHFIQPVASINMFKKHPVIGVGFGTYNRNFGDNVNWKWLRQSFGFEAYPQYLASVEKKTLSFDPHSVYLGALAETGLLGFLGLMCFFIGYMIMLIKRFRNTKKYDFQNIVCGCILAGFAGFLLNGITLDILSMRHFWFMMAIGAASYER